MVKHQLEKSPGSNLILTIYMHVPYHLAVKPKLFELECSSYDVKTCFYASILSAALIVKDLTLSTAINP